MHFSLCSEVYSFVLKLVVKSYEDTQHRTFRKLELGHHVTMVDFMYLEGEVTLIHKAKTRASVLWWGLFFPNKAVLTKGKIGPSSFTHMENGIGTPSSLMSVFVWTL